MTQRELVGATAPSTASLRDALLVIDRSGTRVCLLVDEAGRLAGLLTDGDLRRAILRGTSLDDRALDHATTSPHTVAAGSPRALVLDLLAALHISAVPEVDGEGTLVGLHTLSDVVGAKPLPNVAVIMAGGRGSRLGDLTDGIHVQLLADGRPVPDSQGVVLREAGLELDVDVDLHVRVTDQ